MPFDIGFLELCLVAIIALLVLGPERLPVAARTVGIWVSKAKNAFSSVKDEINRELQIEDLRKQIKDQQDKVEQLVNSGQESIDDYARKTQAQIEETREAFQQEMEQQTIHQKPSDANAIHYKDNEVVEEESAKLEEYEPLPNYDASHLSQPAEAEKTAHSSTVDDSEASMAKSTKEPAPEENHASSVDHKS